LLRFLGWPARSTQVGSHPDGVPIYNISDPRYAWLEEGKYLSHGVVEGDKIKTSQYRVQHPHDLAELIVRVAAIRGGSGARRINRFGTPLKATKIEVVVN
jgi:hypothetical protein